MLGPREGMGTAARLGLDALFVTREEGRLAEHMSPAFAAMLD